MHQMIVLHPAVLCGVLQLSQQSTLRDLPTFLVVLNLLQFHEVILLLSLHLPAARGEVDSFQARLLFVR